MSFLDDLTIPYERVELERFRFGVQQALSASFAERADIRCYEDHVLKHMVYQITQAVYGQRLDRIVARYPADWWQAFKARWAPAWFKRRHPVREHVVEVDVVALYPKIALPKERPYLHVFRQQRLALSPEPKE